MSGTAARNELTGSVRQYSDWLPQNESKRYWDSAPFLQIATECGNSFRAVPNFSLNEFVRLVHLLTED